MDYTAAQKGSVKALSSEALPSCSSSTQLFANAPDGTVLVQFTLRSGGLTIRFDAGTATAGANGQDYAAGSHEMVLTSDELKRCRAIQNGGTTTGWITYFGIK